MPIVDAHAHLGRCRIFDLEVKPEELLAVMDRAGVDAAIVMPFPGADDPKRVHDEIAELGQKHPGRVFGMVNITPHCNPDEYVEEVFRCVRDLGFVGIKLHTVGHAVNPLTEGAKVAFQAAKELNVPLMVHSGPGIPFALPTHILPRAKAFKDVKIVIAHAGFTFFTGEALIVAQECPNVYLETSWLFPDDIRWLVNALGANRVMMGTDLPRNVRPALLIVEEAGLTVEQREWMLARTAMQVFGLKL